MDDEPRKECPICASRNISYSEREKAIVCRDCSNVVAGTPVKIVLPKEEAIEVVHEKEISRKFISKIKKAKAKKKAKKKKTKAKKPSKKKVRKVQRKNLIRRLLKRR